MAKADHSSSILHTELKRYKQMVLDEVQHIVAEKRFRPILSDLLVEYPLREGKGLRPALCLATCVACGGREEDAITSAAALELFHNAFLIHDDIEDESVYRRGGATLGQKYGTAIAINVGDALNVLSVSCLLKNTAVIGLERSLRIFHEIERMACESVEGQAMELNWVKAQQWQVSERDYFLMTSKKTSWYTCIAPCRIGAVIAGQRDGALTQLKRFGFFMGIAFQIQDDVLNLAGDEARYGKESAGDIWEGKRTLMLIHLLGRASPCETRQVIEILSLPRCEKTQGQVDRIMELLQMYGSLEYSRRVSRQFASKAKSILDTRLAWLPRSRQRSFIYEVVEYVIDREL